MSKYYLASEPVHLPSTDYILTQDHVNLIIDKVQSGAWQPYDVKKYLRGNHSKYNPMPKWSIDMLLWNQLEELFKNYA